MEENTFNLKRLKRRLKKITWAYVALLLGFQLIGAIPQLIFASLAEQGVMDPNLASFLGVDISIYLLGFPLFYFILKNEPCTKIEKTDNKLTFISNIKYVIICLGASYLFNMISLGIYQLIAWITKLPVNGNITSEALDSTSSIYTFIFVVLVAPILEELVFRKFAISRFIDLGEKYAIIFSAIMFGLFHCNLSQILYAIPIGIVLAYVYIKSGNILYSILIHMQVNFLGSFLMPLLVGMNIVNDSIVGCFVIAIIILAFILVFINKKKCILNPSSTIPLTTGQLMKYTILTPGFITNAIIVLIFVILLMIASIAMAIE